jgi:hypothetical protein
MVIFYYYVPLGEVKADREPQSIPVDVLTRSQSDTWIQYSVY